MTLLHFFLLMNEKMCIVCTKNWSGWGSKCTAPRPFVPHNLWNSWIENFPEEAVVSMVLFLFFLEGGVSKKIIACEQRQSELRVCRWGCSRRFSLSVWQREAENWSPEDAREGMGQGRGERPVVGEGALESQAEESGFPSKLCVWWIIPAVPDIVHSLGQMWNPPISASLELAHTQPGLPGRLSRGATGRDWGL